MNDVDILKGKKLLVVDDEPDVLETIVELLDMCQIDAAPDFETAQKFLDKNTYDVAILDIMGVSGYDLLEITNKKGVPSLMFTAHALNADDFVKSIEGGAKAYVPKEKMFELASYVADLLRLQAAGDQQHRSWFGRLKTFFDKQFGSEWKDRRDEFWEKYDWLDPSDD